jgi:integrase/recombinase XerD
MQAKRIIYKNEQRIEIEFSYDAELIKRIRQIPGAQWSKTLRAWHIPDNEVSLADLLRLFPEVGTSTTLSDRRQETECGTLSGVEVSAPGNHLLQQGYKSQRLALDEESTEYILDFRKWMEHKRYSKSTIDTYTETVRIFLGFMLPKSVNEIVAEDMVCFVNDYIIKRKLSYAYQNQFVNAAKLFFREVIKSRMDVEKFERPRREHRLPNVLSKEEVGLIIKAHTNVKHRTMLSLIYACGLRRSELLNLKPLHVDSKRKLLIIVNAKGKKDRIVPITDKIIEMLRDYYKIYRPRVWLFEGQNIGEQYSEQSLQSVLKQSLEKCKIKKPVTLHWLRHSYATHLLEGGTDLRYIQELLGHKSSRTTEIYTHVSTKSIQKIKSPFDDL